MSSIGLLLIQNGFIVHGDGQLGSISLSVLIHAARTLTRAHTYTYRVAIWKDVSGCKNRLNKRRGKGFYIYKE